VTVQPETFLDGKVTLWAGDCLSVLDQLEECSVDSIVCDPPYHLTSIVKRFGTTSKQDDTKTSARARAGADGMARMSRGFMGKQWDGGDIAFHVETWEKVCAVLKPGGHLVAFSGTRTYHRMACAIEDAGFEIRDQIGWAYGSGFPKSHDVSKGIDRTLGAEREKIRIPASKLKNPPNLVGGAVKGDDRPWRESAMALGFHEAVSDEAVSDEAVSWRGWGTALKPAWEPIVLARKPLERGLTVAQNVLKWERVRFNIDGCRVEAPDGITSGGAQGRMPQPEDWGSQSRIIRSEPHAQGRWPANIIHDGSDEVLTAFPDSDGAQGRVSGSEPSSNERYILSGLAGRHAPREPRNDTGSAARFFYTAKADFDDRLGSKHPTVKPLDLMQYLCRLVTPPNGLVLDLFAGTGTTGEAAWREGFRAVLIEREEEYQADIRRRMSLALGGPEERRRESIKARGLTSDAGPLFGHDGGGSGVRTNTATAKPSSSSRPDHRPDRTQVVSK